MNELATMMHSTKRMSSLEIAEVMEKNHSHIMRDIRNLIDQGAINQSNFGLVTYTDAKGEERPMYQLDFDATMVLITGYDARRRAMLIKRWRKLETGEAVPDNFNDVLLGSPVITLLMNGQEKLLDCVERLIVTIKDGGIAQPPAGSRPRETARCMDFGAVREFVYLYCLVGGNGFVTKDTLYSAYRVYREDDNAYTEAKPNFFAKLYAAFPELTPRRIVVEGRRTAIVAGLEIEGVV
jgi:Rha family phage regulatory protein